MNDPRLIGVPDTYDPERAPEVVAASLAEPDRGRALVAHEPDGKEKKRGGLIGGPPSGPPPLYW